MQKILLIEDSVEFQFVVRRALARLDAELVTAQTLAESKSLLQGEEPLQNLGLIIADLGLPDGDALEFLGELLENPSFQEVPIFLLTHRGDLAAKVAAFSLGIDDYLVKPMNSMELAARVEMRLRKSNNRRRPLQAIRKGNLLLQPSLLRAAVITPNGHLALDLTGKEFKLLTFLATNDQRTYSRPQLVRAVWGESVHVLERTVDSHICSIRRKLKEHAHLIECIPGVGYRFRADVHEDAPPPPLLQPNTIGL